MKHKALTRFARVEPTQAAVNSGVSEIGSVWNKKIFFYVTDGKRILRLGEPEPYTEAKEKFYKQRIIFIDEKFKEGMLSVRQDLGNLRLSRIG